MKLLLTALAATAAFANAYTEEALADQITTPLPGMTEMPGEYYLVVRLFFISSAVSHVTKTAKAMTGLRS